MKKTASNVWAETADFLELTKPRVTFLILFTTLVGFIVGTRGTIPLPLLIRTMLGTALVAGGAGALNMYAERKLDALMGRTALRPLASGRLRSGRALAFALSISAAGFLCLFFSVNHLTGLLSALVFAGYLFLYTPLKKRTWLCTFVGAIPGALPSVMGWTAASASFSPGAWVLFAIIFLWQLPHFYSIAWIYREDYDRAGLPLLPVIDQSGQRTGRQTVLFIVALIIFTLLPPFFGIAGRVYLIEATVLGLVFLAYGICFARLRDRFSARRLFVVSALYLPALLILLLIGISAK